MGRWLSRLFRRRRTDWDWGLPGSPKTLRAHEENIRLFEPKVTYPQEFAAPSIPEALPDLENGQEPVNEGKVLAEEPATMSTMQGALPPVNAKATVAELAASKGRLEGKVVLEFESGRMILEDENPMVKEFIRAADRMMRPKRRLFGKVG
jgi:hypothetical protein